MSEAAIIINVKNQPHVYLKGPLGIFTVPAADEHGFGMLVVRPMGEIQDIGSMQSRRNEPIPALKLCTDIMGEKGKQMGLLVCKANPDVPKSLEKAEQAEREFLFENRGEVRSKLNQNRKMHEMTTVYEPEVKAEMIKLSKKVSEERAKFEAACREMVTPKEVAEAKKNLMDYALELCKEGDRLYSMESTRKDINVPHQWAAAHAGHSAPWCSDPTPKQPCVGCGSMVRTDVATCPSCHAVLDEKKAKQVFPGGLPWIQGHRWVPEAATK